MRDGPCSPADLRISVGIKHRQTFRANYLNPALRNDLICAKSGLSPHDPNIRYSLTDLGRRLLQENSSTDEGNVGSSTKTRAGATGEEKQPQDEDVKGGVNEALNVLSSGERTIKRTIKEELLEVIFRTPGVAGPALIAATGKGRTIVMEALAALRRAGKVEHRGSKKTGGYYCK